MSALSEANAQLGRRTASDDRVFLEYLRHAPDGPPYPVAEVFASRVYHG